MLFQIGKINWDKIKIDYKLDDEGRLEFVSEEQVYAVLGLKGEDDHEKQERERRTGGDGPSNAKRGCDESSGAIPILQTFWGKERCLIETIQSWTLAVCTIT
jgi:hypothetical protein